jgi:hypothetical protein
MRDQTDRRPIHTRPGPAAFFRLAVLAVCWTAAVAANPAQEAAQPRAARSVHLRYPAPDGASFYNEVAVDESVNGSYFCVCGWNTGYCGIQQLSSPDDKVVIFSVWDAARGNNPGAVPESERVEVLYAGEGVKASRFGGEGTGAKSMFPHKWKIGETNRFLIEAKVEGVKTAYTAWFHLNEGNQWKKLASFRTFSKGSPLKGYYSFVEDFRRDGRSARESRRARYNNGWVKTTAGDWTALTRALFTGDSTPTMNIDAAASDHGFHLATGGTTTNSVPLRTTLARAATGSPPSDLPAPEPRAGR